MLVIYELNKEILNKLHDKIYNYYFEGKQSLIVITGYHRVRNMLKLDKIQIFLFFFNLLT